MVLRLMFIMVIVVGLTRSGGDMESFYDRVNYYDDIFGNGTLATFRFWHQLYYPKYVLAEKSTFIDHILVNAIKRNRIDIVHYIIEQDYELDKNYLNTALKFSTFEMCQCLLDHGFELESKTDDVLGYCMRTTVARSRPCEHYHEFFFVGL